MNKMLLTLEIIWIVLGTICAAMAIKVALTTGGSKIVIFTAMALISFLFALLRHKQRKKS